MINQFRHLIIRPTLQKIGHWSQAAENLLLGTAIQESMAFTFIRQYPAGPGKGVYQIEPATHEDIYKNFLAFRENLNNSIIKIRGIWNLDNALMFNFEYATAIARIVYLRRPEPLPHDDPDNPEKLAKLWKIGFNTIKGKGKPEEFVEKYEMYVKGKS